MFLIQDEFGFQAWYRFAQFCAGMGIIRPAPMLEVSR